jgi:hypothetical protein
VGLHGLPQFVLWQLADWHVVDGVWFLHTFRNGTTLKVSHPHARAAALSARAAALRRVRDRQAISGDSLSVLVSSDGVVTVNGLPLSAVRPVRSHFGFARTAATAADGLALRTATSVRAQSPVRIAGSSIDEWRTFPHRRSLRRDAAIASDAAIATEFAGGMCAVCDDVLVGVAADRLGAAHSSGGCLVSGNGPK